MKSLKIILVVATTSLTTFYIATNYLKNTVIAEEFVILPKRQFISSNEQGNTYAFFTGTWRIEGEKVAFTKTQVSYDYNLADGYCTEFEATVYENVLSTNSQKLPLMKWTNEQIHINGTPHSQCCESIIIVNLLTEDVMSITKNREGWTHEECGQFIPYLSSPRKAYLKDGLKSTCNQHMAVVINFDNKLFT